MNVPLLDGVHHLKLPVTDLDRSLTWWQSRLGYEVELEFVEDGVRRGVSMKHPNGGPRLALRQDPQRAKAVVGFDFFSFGVPDKAAIDDVAAHFTALDEHHPGVQEATIGWILTAIHDPDGHEVRFYTHQSRQPAGQG